MGTTKDTREAVEAELEFDPLVDDADIHVVSIYGDVALNGTVASYPQCLEAAAASTLEAEGIAAATTGVAIA
jgi:osmotically-inducible protein OsmY